MSRLEGLSGSVKGHGEVSGDLGKCFGCCPLIGKFRELVSFVSRSLC